MVNRLKIASALATVAATWTAVPAWADQAAVDAAVAANTPNVCAGLDQTVGMENLTVPVALQEFRDKRSLTTAEAKEVMRLIVTRGCPRHWAAVAPLLEGTN